MIRPSHACIVALAACSSATGLGNRAGPYVMSAVDQSDLPQLVGATSLCDQLVARGALDLQTDGTFLLQVAQIQDCARSGGAADSFTTTVTGAFTVTGTQLTLHPAGTGLQYGGTLSPGALEVQLPRLPLVSSASHVARFVKFPL